MKIRLGGSPCQALIKSGKLCAGFVMFLLIVLIVDGHLGTALLHAATEGEAEEGMNWVNFGWRAFNFVVLAGLLYWLLADKVRDFFKGRENDVRSTLEDLTSAREEAEKKFAEYSAKLDKATEEIRGMSDMILKQGLVEKERIIAAAQKSAAKMKEDAAKRMDNEMKMARHELRADAVRLSVQMAREILKKNITADDHAGMVGDYIDQVVSKH